MNRHNYHLIVRPILLGADAHIAYCAKLAGYVCFPPLEGMQHETFPFAKKMQGVQEQ